MCIMWNKENWAVTFLLTLLGIRVIVGDWLGYVASLPRRMASFVTTL